MFSMMYTYLRSVVESHVKSERGATAVEYGIMVALIAVVIIAGVTLLGTNLLSRFNSVAGSIGP